MLMGQYEHSIDPKNRINFPAKFREQLGENFILTVGLDECIAVYSAEEWDKLEQKINQLPMSRGRSVKRYFFSNAVTVEPDKQGRILISSTLRKDAGIDKDAGLVGMGNRIEIWSGDMWANQLEASEDDEEDALAYRAGLGI